MIKSKIFNSNSLKLIAIFAMTIDHIAWVWVDTYTVTGMIMHIIGRMTVPIMCFFVAEGFLYTHDIKKYILRMFVFMLISHVPFCLIDNIEILSFRTSVMLPLLCGLIALYTVNEKRINIWLKVITVILLCCLSSVGDWMFFPVLWILAFGMFRENTKMKIISFLVITAFANIVYLSMNHNSFFMIGLFTALPIILLYNGEHGKKNLLTKWGFYIYYPLHMTVIVLIDKFII